MACLQGTRRPRSDRRPASRGSTTQATTIEALEQLWYASGFITIRDDRCKGAVLITVDGAPLDWWSSLAVRNHSPTRPAWGYGGSGPAQLALAILLAVTDEATVQRFYQRFKWDVLAPIEADRWALDADDVRGWLKWVAGTDEVVRLAVEER